MAEVEKKPTENKTGKGITRRQFVTGTGTVLVGGGLAGWLIGNTALSGARALEVPENPVVFTDVGGQAALRDLVTSMPPSAGYLVYDSKKCVGCLSCMAACSMAHEKSASLSLSRIQITQASLAPFPFDLDQYQCRQCTAPLCVEICPTGACHIDTANGNVRVIDQEECNGCRKCLDACPQQPHRTIWNPATNKATKCDLCADAPYLGEKGGPGGTQACVSVCPMGALSVVTTAPDQTDNNAYDVNLRAAPTTTTTPTTTST